MGSRAPRTSFDAVEGFMADTAPDLQNMIGAFQAKGIRTPTDLGRRQLHPGSPEPSFPMTSTIHEKLIRTYRSFSLV